MLARSHLASVSPAKQVLLLILEKAEKLQNWGFISLLFLPISQTASTPDLPAVSSTISSLPLYFKYGYTAVAMCSIQT